MAEIDREELKKEILGQLAFFESGSIYQTSKLLGIKGTTLDAASDTIMYFVEQYAAEKEKAARIDARIDELKRLPNGNIETAYHGSTDVVLASDIIKRIAELQNEREGKRES